MLSLRRLPTGAAHPRTHNLPLDLDQYHAAETLNTLVASTRRQGVPYDERLAMMWSMRNDNKATQKVLLETVLDFLYPEWQFNLPKQSKRSC